MHSSLNSSQKVAVLGAGSWGTALAVHLKRSNHNVILWGNDQDVLSQIASGENRNYLPGSKFAEIPACSNSLEDALSESKLVVLAVPSAATRGVAQKMAPYLPKEAIVVNAAKGLEEGSNKRLSEVLVEQLPNSRIAILSGPSFAREVLEKKPTAITVAARDLLLAEEAAKFFHYDYLRVYTSTDLAGIEYGGALKNVLALAIGIADGMEMGLNTRAALITRGLAELGRFVEKLGGKRSTVTGLSGLGDLLLTATGDLSRNRQVGLRLGRGEKLDAILKSLGQVAEGVKTAAVAKTLADSYLIDAPIVQEIFNVISGSRSPQDSLRALLEREQKSEE